MVITITPAVTAAEAPVPDASSHLTLIAWLSPTYPVGAYAYSHGLEWAAEAGDITDEASLGAWLGDLLEHGIGRIDPVLLAAAHRAATAGDVAGLSAANDLALALAPSQELHLETRQQGRSFLDATLAAWPSPRLSELAAPMRDDIAYPVAVGLAAGAHSLPLPAAAEIYLLALVQNFVSAALRLAPIGQAAGARVLAKLAPGLARLAREALERSLDDIGSATFRADLGSFLHETQYTRLFRS